MKVEGLVIKLSFSMSEIKKRMMLEREKYRDEIQQFRLVLFVQSWVTISHVGDDLTPGC